LRLITSTIIASRFFLPATKRQSAEVIHNSFDTSLASYHLAWCA